MNKKRGLVGLIVTILLLLVGIILAYYFSISLISSGTFTQPKENLNKIVQEINKKQVYIVSNSKDVRVLCVETTNQLGIKNIKMVDDPSYLFIKGSVVFTGGSKGPYKFKDFLDPSIFKSQNCQYEFDPDTGTFRIYSNSKCSINTNFKFNDFNLVIKNIDALSNSYLLNISSEDFQLLLENSQLTVNSKIESRNTSITLPINSLEIIKIKNKIRIEVISSNVNIISIYTIPSQSNLQITLSNISIENPYLTVDVDKTDLPNYYTYIDLQTLEDLLSQKNVVMYVYKNYFNINIRGLTDKLKFNNIITDEVEGNLIPEVHVKAVNIKESPSYFNCLLKSNNYWCLSFTIPVNQGIVLFLPYELINLDNQNINDKILQKLENYLK